MQLDRLRLSLFLRVSSSAYPWDCTLYGLTVTGILVLASKMFMNVVRVILRYFRNNSRDDNHGDTTPAPVDDASNTDTHSESSIDSSEFGPNYNHSFSYYATTSEPGHRDNHTSIHLFQGVRGATIQNMNIGAVAGNVQHHHYN